MAGSDQEVMGVIYIMRVIYTKLGSKRGRAVSATGVRCIKVAVA